VTAARNYNLRPLPLCPRPDAFGTPVAGEPVKREKSLAPPAQPVQWTTPEPYMHHT